MLTAHAKEDSTMNLIEGFPQHQFPEIKLQAEKCNKLNRKLPEILKQKVGKK